jgi:DNA-binding transcriptional MocR family regulator
MPVSIALQHDPEDAPSPTAPPTAGLIGPENTAYAPAANDDPQRWYLRGSGKFAILPLKVLSDKGLKLAALRVLIGIAKHADPNSGICPADTNAPSLDSLAALSGMHRVNVSKATGILEKRGWLKKTRQGGGRPTLFTLAIPNEPEKDGTTAWNPMAYDFPCFIPVEFAGDSSLTLETVRVFLALSAHAKKEDGTCFPGRNRTSRLTGMHVNNVSDATRKLEKAGWLTRTLRFGHSNEYKLTVPDKPDKKEPPPYSRQGFEDVRSFPSLENLSLEYLRTPYPADADPER